jgi:hypothetical protein
MATATECGESGVSRSGKYVAIGSARIERMLRRPRQLLQTGQRLRVLWASEFWNNNTLGRF